jgi:ACS family hexuronate transporter-like MFS transporter
VLTQASYTVMQTVAGAVLDALGTRIGFFVFAIGWALSNMAHAFATGWMSLAAFRAALGATDGCGDPGWRQDGRAVVPPQERPLATSLFQMGTSVGNMIAPPLVAFCILAWDWQAAFLVTGGLSLIWAGLWWFAYRDPADHPRLLAGRARCAGRRQQA